MKQRFRVTMPNMFVLGDLARLLEEYKIDTCFDSAMQLELTEEQAAHLGDKMREKYPKFKFGEPLWS